MTFEELAAQRIEDQDVLEVIEHEQAPQELREALHERLVALALEQPEVVVLPAR